MKFVVLFILAFVVISLMPFLWNHFSFVEGGFPFRYLEIRNSLSSDGTFLAVIFQINNLIYDLVIVAILTVVFIKFGTTIQKSDS